MFSLKQIARIKDLGKDSGRLAVQRWFMMKKMENTGGINVVFSSGGSGGYEVFF